MNFGLNLFRSQEPPHEDQHIVQKIGKLQSQVEGIKREIEQLKAGSISTSQSVKDTETVFGKFSKRREVTVEEKVSKLQVKLNELTSTLESLKLEHPKEAAAATKSYEVAQKADVAHAPSTRSKLWG